jgi:Fe2+ transport system protein FeoA
LSVNLKLSDIPNGQEVNIVEIKDKGLLNRLCEMGLRMDRPISIVNRAPLRGAYMVRSGQLLLAIRSENLKKIIIQTI